MNRSQLKIRPDRLHASKRNSVRCIVQNIGTNNRNLSSQNMNCVKYRLEANKGLGFSTGTKLFRTSCIV